MNQFSIDIKRGDLVEFADKAYQDYPPSDKSVIRYGVAIEDGSSQLGVTVRTAQDEAVQAIYIYSFAWAGWIPEELEAIYAEVNADLSDWDEYE